MEKYLADFITDRAKDLLETKEVISDLNARIAELEAENKQLKKFWKTRTNILIRLLQQK